MSDLKKINRLIFLSFLFVFLANSFETKQKGTDLRPFVIPKSQMKNRKILKVSEEWFPWPFYGCPLQYASLITSLELTPYPNSDSYVQFKIKGVAKRDLQFFSVVFQVMQNLEQDSLTEDYFMKGFQRDEQFTYLSSYFDFSYITSGLWTFNVKFYTENRNKIGCLIFSIDLSNI